MLRSWVATYERPSEYIDHPAISTRLYVRAETYPEALRLADQVFEQIYGTAPGRLGFNQTIVRVAMVM